MTPWVAVRWLEVRAGLAVFVGRDVPGTPIGGLLRAPERAMPCPFAPLAKTARLAKSNHGVLTPNYYGKFLQPPAIGGLVRVRGQVLKPSWAGALLASAEVGLFSKRRYA